MARSAEDKVWEWFADLVSDDEKLERGLQKLEDNESDEVGYRLGRLETIKAMMDKTDQKIKRLMSNFGDEDDETIAGALQAEIKALAKQRDALRAERQSLESEIASITITPKAREQFGVLVEMIRRKIANPTHQHKREAFEFVNMKIVFRVDDAGRWLDVSCRLKPEGDVIELPSSPGRPYPPVP